MRRTCSRTFPLWYCLFVALIQPLPSQSTLFPYTTLFRSVVKHSIQLSYRYLIKVGLMDTHNCKIYIKVGGGTQIRTGDKGFADLDRKSTRLNSSHVSISYAVFCLKKKNTNCKTRNKLNKE